MRNITTLEQAKRETYGSRLWPQAYVEGRCCVRVPNGTRCPDFYQCARKNGHGPDGLYCKQHSPDTIAARERERRQLWSRQKAAQEKRWALEAVAPDMLAALRLGLEMQAPGDIWSVNPSKMKAFLEAARAAVAKAEGKESK